MHAVATHGSARPPWSGPFSCGGFQPKGAGMKKHYLLASDFDQTLSFNDSGIVLSEMLGITSFREKVAAPSVLNLVQQGADRALLPPHDAAVAHLTRDDPRKDGRQGRLEPDDEL